MKPKTAAWGRILEDATERVQNSVSAIALGDQRSRSLGTGASGDKTLLADKEAEDELTRALLGVEGLRVISEEAGEIGDPRAKLLAVVDPVDGSSNFERGIPFYCSSVAIAEGTSLSSVFFAVVRDLVTGDFYSATKGHGATKNGRSIHTSTTKSLSQSVVAVDQSRTTQRVLRRIEPVVMKARRQVHLGADALELCFVADGRFDAMLDLRGRIRVTDFAGAYLISKEAGAVVTSDEGETLDVPLDLETRLSFVAAANSAIHEQILSCLASV